MGNNLIKEDVNRLRTVSINISDTCTKYNHTSTGEELIGIMNNWIADNQVIIDEIQAKQMEERKKYQDEEAARKKKAVETEENKMDDDDNDKEATTTKRASKRTRSNKY